MVVCACEDATLSLIKLAQGTQICCPIVLDSRASVINAPASTNYCMCITTAGYVYVWHYECVDEQTTMPITPATSTHAKGSSFLSRESSCELGNFFNLTAIISQLSCQFLLRGNYYSILFV